MAQDTSDGNTDVRRGRCPERAAAWAREVVATVEWCSWTTLLERERELAAVEQLLGTGGAVLVVEGGAGIGKTALLDATCDRAAALGHAVLRARGSRLEAGFGFGVVRQLFERRVAQAGEHERDALLAGAARAVRPLLLGEALETAATDTSFAVLHGLYWLTVNLAERRPVLIAVDDTHWADEASLRWLAHLAPRLQAACPLDGRRAPAG